MSSNGFSSAVSGTSGALGISHNGRNFRRHYLRVLYTRDRVRMGVRPTMMTWELIMGSILAAGLTAYLIYAMLRPEKF